MAVVGLSKPYIAKYSNTGTTVTYTQPTLIGKAITMSLSLNSGSENILYADNAPAESDNQFSGGSLTIGTDNLSAEAMLSIFGTKEEAINADGVSTSDAKWLVHDDDQIIPYVGFGGVIMKKVNGATKYVAVIYNKVQFQNLNDSATTKGETIEWQTPELTATLMRSDNVKHEWKRITTDLDTEAEAEAAILAFFG